MAARSRAIAAMSLMTPPPSARRRRPRPIIAMSPACAPVTRAAFCGPFARPKIESRATTTGATQAVSVGTRAVVLGVRELTNRRAGRPRLRAKSAWLIADGRPCRNVVRRRRGGRTRARTESPAWRARRLRRDPGRHPLRQSPSRALVERLRQRARRLCPCATARRWSCRSGSRRCA